MTLGCVPLSQNYIFQNSQPSSILLGQLWPQKASPAVKQQLRVSPSESQFRAPGTGSALHVIVDLPAPPAAGGTAGPSAPLAPGTFPPASPGPGPEGVAPRQR